MHTGTAYRVYEAHSLWGLGVIYSDHAKLEIRCEKTNSDAKLEVSLHFDHGDQFFRACRRPAASIILTVTFRAPTAEKAEARTGETSKGDRTCERER